MKRLRTLFLVATLTLALGLKGQTSDKNLFNHLDIGVSVGTDGLIGFDAAAPLTDYVRVRAGAQFMPKFKATADIDYNRTKSGVKSSYTDKAEGKLNMDHFKLLFDAYPFMKSSFHVTAGAYIGTKQLIDIYNKGPLSGVTQAEWGTAQIQISDNPVNFFGTDPNGNVKGRVTVNSFKPYLGLGFGRSSKDKLVSVNFDLGVQFWGTPKVEIYNYVDPATRTAFDPEWRELKKSDFNDHDDDGYKVLNTLSKVTVWPVLNLRVSFRAF